jgi:hypothetical protein
MNKKPDSTQQWIVSAKSPVAKHQWIVICRSCNTTTTRTTKQIETNSSPCKCQRQRKNAITLTYNGTTMPLSAWLKRYPSMVNANSVRIRHYQRKSGQRDYTDEEVLFGARTGAPVFEEDRSISEKAEIARIPIEIVNAAQSKLVRMFEELVADYVAPVVARLQRVDTKSIQVAGSDFVLENSGGLTIGDYLSAGMDINEILPMVEMETFPSNKDRTERLRPFITVEDYPPDVDQTVTLTRIQIEQLFSIVKNGVVTPPQQ